MLAQTEYLEFLLRSSH